MIERAGPLTTIQDRGRFGALGFGIAASGPMDRGAFEQAGALLEVAGSSGIEFTRAGICFSVERAPVRAGFAGAAFTLTVNDEPRSWPAVLDLAASDRVDIAPGAEGNYGYVRFSRELGVPPVLRSRATNIVAGLGGLVGRPLRRGDWIDLISPEDRRPPLRRPPQSRSAGPLRVTWGLHASLLDAETRLQFETAEFEVSARLDRMGVRLVDGAGVFGRLHGLSLVSDAIIPGDIQILGDGTPIVLMRDHQPTGGYPRVATVISADLDRFAQVRPGTRVRFEPVTPQRARTLLLELA
jgi:allophanate hydrolase